MAEIWDKESLVVETPIDIREAEKVGDSGAEAFFCDELKCKKEQEIVKKIVGLKTSEDFVYEIMESYVSDIKSINNELNKLTKLKEYKIKLLESLAIQTECDFEWKNSNHTLRLAGIEHDLNVQDCVGLQHGSFLGIYSGPNMANGH